MATPSSVMAVIRASRPKFKNPHDKIVFALHAAILSAGYSLVAAGDSALSDNPPLDGEEVGIDGWNEVESAYGFVYTKAEKGLKKTVLVKCLPIGDTLVVDFLDPTEEQKEPFNVQINVKEHLQEVTEQISNYGEYYKNFEGLVNILNTGVLSKLDLKSSSASSSKSGERSRSSSTHDTSVSPVHPRAGVQQEPEPSGLVYPPIFPSGHSDLYPSPGAGFYPTRNPGIGGGMLVGPDDPRFFGPLGQQPNFPGGIPGVPPGARFDPYGPPDIPGFNPARFARPGRRPGGNPHPDLEPFRHDDFI